MSRAECLRRLSAAWLSVGVWLLAIAGAQAQIEFRTGSLLQGAADVGQAWPSVMSQPLEILPPTAAQPFGTQATDGLPALSLPVARPDFEYHFGGKGRGYYINDQRIEFTGVEATFAVEGVLEGGLVQHAGGWDLSFETQLFLNQPFGRNVLVDNPERQSFAANFDIDPLQISQLY